MEELESKGSASPRVPLRSSNSGNDFPANLAQPRWLWAAVAFYAALSLISVGWVAVRGGALFFVAAGPGGATPASLVGDSLLGIMLGACFVVCSQQFSMRTRSGRRTAQLLAEALGPLSVRACLLLALASAMGEELFFRGLLQPRIGLTAASLLFGLAHLAPRRELALWTISSVLAGFALGSLFEHTGNLLAPFAAHFTIIAINLRWLVVRHAGGDPRRFPDSPAGVR